MGCLGLHPWQRSCLVLAQWTGSQPKPGRRLRAALVCMLALSAPLAFAEPLQAPPETILQSETVLQAARDEPPNQVTGLELAQGEKEGAQEQSVPTLLSLFYATESYPPFNFEVDGMPSGISVDLLLAAIASEGEQLPPKDIHMTSWPRAYQQTLRGPKRVLFSTTRTPQRESLFQWAGPIAPIRVVLLARKSSGIRITDAGELRKFNIGVIRDDIGEQLLLARGVPGTNLRRISNADSLARMLARGRIQLWAYQESVARWFIKQNQLSNADFSVAYVLDEAELYYAFSLDVPVDLVRQLQRGLDRLHQTRGESGESRYSEILAKYRN
jgi:polar amino acid transport system substrate-binding protein